MLSSYGLTKNAEYQHWLWLNSPLGIAESEPASHSYLALLNAAASSFRNSMIQGSGLRNGSR
jgi:hypothetical protein